MAAAANDVSIEDDDAWLYGDNTADDDRKDEITAIFERASEDVVAQSEESQTLSQNGDIGNVPETSENGIAPAENEKPAAQENDEEKDSDDEDSDDDVQITIGDIKPSATAYPYGGTPVNLNIKRGNVFTSGAAVTSGAKSKGLDMDSIGMINGVSLFEFNLDTIEDKPWRKPGADITDYFNYGFNEDVWKGYCEKQRKLRMDNSTNVVTNKPSSIIGVVPDQQIPIATVNENSKYAAFGSLLKKAGPPPGRRTSGSIDVICGANSAARKAGNAKENSIPVMTGRSEFDGTLPPGLPPTHIPPPFIPPNLSVPPPGVHPGIPPPNLAIPGALPGHMPYTDMFGNPLFSQPPPPIPGVIDIAPKYDEQFYTGTSGRGYDANSESTQHSWNDSPRDRERGRDRDRDGHRDRSRDRERYSGYERERVRLTEEELTKRREEYERRRYYRERRDKERHERDHDREYDHEEHRDSRERDRERKHRDYKDREERHKERSSRRRHHHEEEDEKPSSRHKHKKSKREKEDTNPEAVTDTSSQPEPEPEEAAKT